jgi:hypothetical protein
MGDPFFVLTNEQIEEWRTEEKAAERLIVDGQQRLQAVRKKLDAAAVLAGHMPAQKQQASPLFGEEDDKAPEAMNMVKAIEEIANGSAVPVNRHDLRRMLIQRGFPKDRMGNYFYTAVSRLKAAERISVRADGSVWKGQRDAA